MMNRSTFWRRAVGLILLLWAVTLFPYGALYLFGRLQGRVFVGLIYNLYDGLSYLAKMQQGFRGAWLFRLPYTADSEPSAWLFVFHLALGHLAREWGLPIPLMYHIARLLGSAAMVVALGWWFRAWKDDLAAWRWAWGWSVFAVGMEAWGYLVQRGSTIPEVYPFLSALVNAHFPWALTFLVVALHPFWPKRLPTPRGGIWALALMLLGFVLALLAPFGVLIAVSTWGLLGFWQRWRANSGSPWWTYWGVAAFLALGAAPYLSYLFWALRADPWLAGWNAQNRTPIEGLGKTFFLFSPWWVLAWWGWTKKKRLLMGLLWVLAGWGWALAPLALQRRMWLGMAIPLVALAWTAYPWPRWMRWGLLLSLAPSWALFILGPLFLARTPNNLLFLSTSEWRAFTWMADHLPPDQRILSGPETSAYIPAFTGQRVFYGHIFETYPASEERAWVEQTLCMQDERAVWQALRARDVGWILWTPREDVLCPPPSWLRRLPVAWKEGEVVLYQVPGEVLEP